MGVRGDVTCLGKVMGGGVGVGGYGGKGEMMEEMGGRGGMYEGGRL